MIAAAAIAIVALVVLACPAEAQENQPNGPAVPLATPESVTDAVIEHLRDARSNLAVPPITKEAVPDVGLEDFDKANPDLKYVLWTWACMLLSEDMEGWLREYAKRYYKDDPKKLEAFNDKLKDYRTTRGSAKQRARYAEAAQKTVDDLRKVVKDIPGPKTIQHMLYHLASSKRIIGSLVAGVPDLAKPLKVWKTVDCPGEDCRLETEPEKAQRKQ